MTTATLLSPTDFGPDAAFTRSTIKAGDMAHVMTTLSRLYSRPMEAVYRELGTNARESNEAAGYTGPVEITRPSYGDPYVTITDHGLGLDYDEIMNVFGDYADSTKRTAEQVTPNFGAGSKSPYAVADHYLVAAVKNGVRHEILFAKLSDGNPGHRFLSVEDTTESNGVTVRVPVTVDEITEWHKAAANVFRWWDKASFVFTDAASALGNSTPLVNYRDRLRVDNNSDQVLVLDFDRPQYHGQTIGVRINGAVYNVPQAFFNGLDVRLQSFRDLIIEMPLDSLKVSPNRESIESTIENQNVLYPILVDWAKASTSLLLTKLEAATNSYHLYRAWAESSDLEKSLSGIDNEHALFAQYDMPGSIKLHYALYPEGGVRSRVDRLIVNELPALISGRALILEQIDERAARIIADWRKAHEAPAVGVFRDKAHLAALIDPDEIEWQTLDDLKAETPTKKAKPVKRVLKDTDKVELVALTKHGYYRRSIMTVAGVKEQLAAKDLPLVVGAIVDYEQSKIPYVEVIALVSPARRKSLFAATFDKKVFSPEEYLVHRYTQEVAAMSEAERQILVERATVPRNAIVRAGYILTDEAYRLEKEPDGSNQRYAPSSLAGLTELADLKESVDPLYLQVPDLPASVIIDEKKHLIALLNATHGPEELLLKMALRADKMMLGDRERKARAAARKKEAAGK